MKIIAWIFAAITIVLLLIAFIPLLGWLNWLVVPFAVLGLVFALLAKSSGSTVVCCVAIVLGMLRLMLGGGII